MISLEFLNMIVAMYNFSVGMMLIFKEQVVTEYVASVVSMMYNTLYLKCHMKMGLIAFSNSNFDCFNSSYMYFTDHLYAMSYNYYYYWGESSQQS